MESPMASLDQAPGGRRIRIDPDRFAEEFARVLHDVDASESMTRARDAAGSARGSLDHATVVARELGRDLRRDIGRDLAKAGGDLHVDEHMDDMAGRIRAVGSTTAVRALVARLERDLPETDRDRYDRAYARGWIRARSTFLAVGLAAGIGAGLIAAALLDPKRGKARRDRIAGRTTTVAQGVQQRLSATAKVVSGRARGLTAEREHATDDGAADAAVLADAPALADAPLPVLEDAPLTEVASETMGETGSGL
jgi:hypothetical protein